MVYCLCGNMCIYIYVYNEWMEWMFLFTLLYVYCCIKFIKQADINIYKFKCKKCQEKEV